MQAAIVLTMLVGAAMAGAFYERPMTFEARPVAFVPSGMDIPIVRANDFRDNQGGYRYGFESANGIVQEEAGSLKNVGTEELANVKTGKVSWTSPEGIPFTLSYTADETGFHPTGDHLPTPPPIPQAILESLALIQSSQKLPEINTFAGNYAAPQTFAVNSFVAPTYAVPSFNVAPQTYGATVVKTAPVVPMEVRKPYGGY